MVVRSYMPNFEHPAKSAGKGAVVTIPRERLMRLGRKPSARIRSSTRGIRSVAPDLQED